MNAKPTVYRFKIAAGTPISAIANVYTPGATITETRTKKDNFFEHCFLQAGEAVDGPESLYEGGQECGWDNKACDAIYNKNANGLLVFTKNLGHENTAILMVWPQYVESVNLVECNL